MTATLDSRLFLPEFRGWPKTARLFRDIIVTEKLDGTNAAVIIGEDERSVAAQSRNRLVMPGKTTDNHGFAAWVELNAADLAITLGPGYHYGEWWGNGIARGYGLAQGDKRFSLFNTEKYGGVDLRLVPGLGLVPVLDRAAMDTRLIGWWLEELRATGSRAAPNYMKPEGVCVFHVASNKVFKVTIENDAHGKAQVSM